MNESKSSTPASTAVSGDLKDFNIFDITQSLMMSRKTCQVTVQSGAKRGYVHFKDGQIVAALDDDLNTGEQAAFKIFYWRGGVFNIEFGVEARERNIKLDTENLLLEIARHMDESTRQAATTQQQATPAADVAEQFDDRFRNELHDIFNRVANDATPARDRYTVRAFDSLLVALNDLGGTALFIRPGSRPRVKTQRGFETIMQELVAPTEIEGFLNSLLSPRERDTFREDKEITAWHSSLEAGTFQVTAFYDYGKPACIFSPSSKSIPPLARIGVPAGLAGEVFSSKSGLWLVAGGLAHGKSTLLASLLEDALGKRDLLVTLFGRHHVHSFSDDRGFIIRADLSRFSLEGDGYLANAVRQGSDVIAVDELGSSGMLRDVLQVASGNALLLATIEAEDVAELGERLAGMVSGHRADKLGRQLAAALRGVLFADLRTVDGRSPSVESIPVSDDLRRALAAGDMTAFCRAAAPVGSRL